VTARLPVWPPMLRGTGRLARESAAWGAFAVVTTPSPWTVARGMLATEPRAVALVESLERAHLEEVAARLAGAERVVGIGGGLAMDGAKYVATRLGLPLVQVPSTTSNNACFTCTAGALTNGRRAPLRGAPVPEQIVVDPGLIGLAPPRLNRAGIGDLVCSHTSLVDWALAREAGLKVDWDDGLADLTRAELARLAAIAPAVGRDDPDAWLALLEIGERLAPWFLARPRARFNSGSEHLLAWCLEERTGRRLLHGEIVSLGVLLMSHLQDNDPEGVARVIADARVEIRPEAIGTTWDEVRAAVLALPAYAREVVPWHTIVARIVEAEGEPGLASRFERARAFVEASG
jgi:glycerol-1-phosphate dehydrogenase [NAD(P)+]